MTENDHWSPSRVMPRGQATTSRETGIRKSQSDFYVSAHPVAEAFTQGRAGLVPICVPDGLGGSWQAIASDLSGNRRRYVFLVRCHRSGL